jgi:hypothetical protein
MGKRWLSDAVRRLAGRARWHLAPASEFQLIPRSYYSPVPDLATLPEGVWTRRSALAGIEFDTVAQIAWAERELAPHVAEFEAPTAASYGPGIYYFR